MAHTAYNAPKSLINLAPELHCHYAGASCYLKQQEKKK